MTGRDLDSTKAKDVEAVFAYALDAFGSRYSAPRAAVDEVAERAAAAYAG